MNDLISTPVRSDTVFLDKWQCWHWWRTPITDYADMNQFKSWISTCHQTLELVALRPRYDTARQFWTRDWKWVENHDSNVSLYSKYKLYMNFIYGFKQINKCQVISKSIQYECIWSSNEVQNLIFEFDIQNKLLWVELKMVYISCIFDRGDWSKILYIIYSILYTFYFVAETFCQKGEKICSKRMWDRIHWPG